MSEMNAGVANDWSGLATLLVLCLILAAVVWYGRKVLSALRVSQEQVGALLKLTIGDAIPEKSSRSGLWFEPAGALHSLTGVPHSADPRAAVLPEAQTPGIGRQRVEFAQGVIRWLRAPIRRNPNRPSGRLIRWLEAPVRS
jgi:hypothetical protein